MKWLGILFLCISAGLLAGVVIIKEQQRSESLAFHGIQELEKKIDEDNFSVHIEEYRTLVKHGIAELTADVDRVESYAELKRFHNNTFNEYMLGRIIDRTQNITGLAMLRGAVFVFAAIGIGMLFRYKRKSKRNEKL